MSKIVVAEIQHPDAAEPALVLSSDGTIAVDGAAESLNDLNDVDTSGAADGDALVFDGTAGEWVPAPLGYTYAGTRYFFSDGTFEKADPLGTGDIGLRAIRVRMVGAGGGGARGGANVGSGGGAGAYAEAFLLVGALSASETVAVGAGGSGDSSQVAMDATAGTSSEFGAGLVLAGGGGPGSTNATLTSISAGEGSQTWVGDVGATGGHGTVPILDMSASFVFYGGIGGSSKWGAGGLYAGFLDAGYGGGGAGADGAQDFPFPGSGGDGLVLVDCYV